jgi:hypothetical protein
VITGSGHQQRGKTSRAESLLDIMYIIGVQAEWPD